jgi:acyl-CoA synthetase (AMP-forming)/AMP-acid ligase II
MLSAAFDYETPHATLLDPWVERVQRGMEGGGLVFWRDDDTEEVVSESRLLTEVLARRRFLESSGLKPGDDAVIALGHSFDLIAFFLACVHAGVVVTIAPVYVDEGWPIEPFAKRLKMLADGSGAATVIAAGGHAESLRNAGCRVISTGDMRAGCETSDTEMRTPVAHDIAFIQYTSGTSGRAKAIAHRHRTVLRYIESKRRAQRITGEDVMVSWLPLYHDLGLVSGLLTPLVLGMKTVLISPFHWVRSPGVLMRAVHAHKGTIVYIPAFALHHCARAVRDRELVDLDLSSLKSLACGAEMVRAGSLDLFAQRFAPCGLRRETMRTGYGLAETVEASTATPLGQRLRIEWLALDTLERERRAQPVEPETPRSRPFVSCGAPLPGVNVRIVDSDGRELPERTVGEVTINGDFVLTGYHRQPSQTALVLRDGWLHTGDLGYVADGELFITGRKKDLIIVGGRNIHPEEVEDLSSGIPGLRPGRSVAFGVDDPVSGSERIVLIAELSGDIDADGKSALVRELRRRSVQELDAALGDVRLVEKGWVIKSSSGKHARPANQAKYLKEFNASS